MRRSNTVLTCDLGPGPATVTRLVALDSHRRLLDLCGPCDDGLTALIRPYLAAGRTPESDRDLAVSQLSERTARGYQSAVSRQRAREIRAWGRERGFKVSSHGRLPARLIREYEASL